MAGTCSTAFGRQYTIFVDSGTLPTARPDGMCWDDPGCGAPDPFVVVTVDGSTASTLAADDTFAPTWAASFEATIFAGSTITLEVFDEDLADDDGAFRCEVPAVEAARLRYGDLSCSGSLGSLTAFIYPAE